MLKLVIGNRNWSSWSLRPWIALRHHAAPFEEIHVPLRQPDTRAHCLDHSPSGKVPVLHHDAVVIWDSLAILEYIAELFPEKGLWPNHMAERARARSVAAEMHAGFPDLRRDMPMEVLARRETPAMTPGLSQDIARIDEIWSDCLEQSGGPFLFGNFTNADAMFAPVASRFTTWQPALSAAAERYRAHIMALPAMVDWIRLAGEENQRPENQGPESQG
ncbi:MAG: glutathione S-transferase family protein [Sphingomonadales bacterium]